MKNDNQEGLVIIGLWIIGEYGNFYPKYLYKIDIFKFIALFFVNGQVLDQNGIS